MMFSKKKEPIIYCYECGCILYSTAKRVHILPGSGYTAWVHVRNFCGRCRPPYDVIGIKEAYYICKQTGDGSDKDPYYLEQVEVTKEGKPIKK